MDLFRSSAFRARVESLLREHHVPGLSAAIVQDDSVESAAWGFASLDPEKPCTPDTIFDVASCAKSLTAASVALLIDDDELFPELQYDSIMADLLPGDFVMPSEEYTRAVTVEDLLSHRTGMAGHDCSYMGRHSRHPDTPASITRNLRNLPVAAPLRSRYLYCNMMYTVATHLVEVKTGMQFGDFLQTRFFAPLEMHSTALQPARARKMGLGDQIAVGYHWNKKIATYCPIEAQDCHEGQGAGSIMSSANDFVKWVHALLDHKAPINKTVYTGLTKLRSIVNPNSRRLKAHSSPALYAAGIEVYYYRGRMVVGHDGHTWGFASRFVFLPEMNFGVVVLGNASGAGAVSTILIRALMDELLGVPMVERALKLDQPEKLGKGKSKKQKQKGQSLTTDRVEVGAMGGSAREQTPHTTPNETKAGSDKIVNRTVKGQSDAAEASAHEVSSHLNKYVGEYWHPGYHTMTVQMMHGELFVDATDRGMGFTLTFESSKDETSWKVCMKDPFDGEEEQFEARFELDDGRVVRMGLDLEPAIKKLIWFSRKDDNAQQ